MSTPIPSERQRGTFPELNVRLERFGNVLHDVVKRPAERPWASNRRCDRNLARPVDASWNVHRSAETNGVASGQSDRMLDQRDIGSRHVVTQMPNELRSFRLILP